MSLWARHFRQKFHLARLLSADARGDEEWSAPEEHPCRYQPSTKRLVAEDGSRVVSEAVLFTAVSLTTKDRVWPPGANPGDEDASRKPIRVDVRHNLQSGAVDHYEVHI